MKEHKDYMVKVKLNASNKPTASVHCALCSKEYKLNEKVTSEPTDKLTFMLSNSTSHIKRCVEIKNRKVARQQSISQFLPSPLNHTTQGTRMCAKQPVYDKSTQGEASSKSRSTTFEHAETEHSLEQSAPLVLNPDRPCSSSSTGGSSGGSSIVNISTEPEEIGETKECVDTTVDSNLQIDSHSPLKSKIESSLSCNSISSPHQNQNFQINSPVWVNQESF